jgi:leader peptidase (prepilin peptidase)/N-methyltransferase
MSGAEILGAVAAAALGACVGSFAGVAIDRLPRGESLGGRSRCICGVQIQARDNLPVVGYLLRGGRARCCGARIPAWYPVVEVAGAVLAMGLYALIVT